MMMSLELSIQNGFIRCLSDGELVWSEPVPEPYHDDFDEEDLKDYLGVIFSSQKVDDVSEPEDDQQIEESRDAARLAKELGGGSFDDDFTKLIHKEPDVGDVARIIRDDKLPLHDRILSAVSDPDSNAAYTLNNLSQKARDEDE